MQFGERWLAGIKKWCTTFSGYTLVSGLSAICDFSVFSYCSAVLALNVWLSNGLAFVVGASITYALCLMLVFSGKRDTYSHWTAAIVFLLIGIVAWLAATIFITMTTSYSELDLNFAKLASMALSLLINFELRRRFVFSNLPHSERVKACQSVPEVL